jgi:hypothetical protein
MGDIKKGDKFIYSPTNAKFTIGKVTDKRVSWYLGFIELSSWGKNEMRMTWTSRKLFEEGLKDGTYIIIK